MFMRMDNSRHPKIPLTWPPEGKNTQSRQNSTWRRTIKGERHDLKFSLSELRGLAQDRNGWRRFVSALYASDRELDNLNRVQNVLQLVLTEQRVQSK